MNNWVKHVAFWDWVSELKLQHRHISYQLIRALNSWNVNVLSDMIIIKSNLFKSKTPHLNSTTYYGSFALLSRIFLMHHSIRFRCARTHTHNIDVNGMEFRVSVSIKELLFHMLYIIKKTHLNAIQSFCNCIHHVWHFSA